MKKFLLSVCIFNVMNLSYIKMSYAQKLDLNSPNAQTLHPIDVNSGHKDDKIIAQAHAEADTELSEFEHLTADYKKIDSISTGLDRGIVYDKSPQAMQQRQEIHNYKTNWENFLKLKSHYEDSNNQLKNTFHDFLKNFREFEQEYSRSSSDSFATKYHSTTGLSWQGCLDMITSEMQTHKNFFMRARFSNPKILTDFATLEKKFSEHLKVDVEKFSKMRQELHLLTGGNIASDVAKSKLKQDAEHIITLAKSH